MRIISFIIAFLISLTITYGQVLPPRVVEYGYQFTGKDTTQINTTRNDTLGVTVYYSTWLKQYAYIDSLIARGDTIYVFSPIKGTSFTGDTVIVIDYLTVEGVIVTGTDTIIGIDSLLGLLSDSLALVLLKTDIGDSLAATHDTIRISVGYFDSLLGLIDSLVIMSHINATSVTADSFNVEMFLDVDSTKITDDALGFEDVANLPEWFAQYTQTTVLIESLSTKITESDLSDSNFMKADNFGDSTAVIDSTYITDDALGIGDVANLNTRLDAALTNNSWDKIDVDTIWMSDNYRLNMKDADSTLRFLTGTGSLDTFYVLMERSRAEHIIMLDFGNVITPVFDTTFNPVSYKVTATRAESLWVGNGYQYISFTCSADCTVAQEVAAYIRVDLPDDFLEFAVYPAVYVTYKYATADTNNQHINFRISDYSDPPTFRFDTTLVGSSTWTTNTISRTSLINTDATWGRLNPSQSLLIKLEVSVKGGSSVYIEDISLYYRKQRRYTEEY